MPSLPTIAIVGRPNVGKSTLFNRLTHTRDALVSDMPGLTRDRREGDADMMGHAVRIVDTAGLEEGKAGTISDRMRKQSETAIELADVVLFVIDARAGITPADAAFARIVRASGKPAVLVANKCEGRRGMDGAYEAFSLGLGDPVTISAEHGEGMGDLAIDTLAALGLKPKPGTKRRGPDDMDEEIIEEPVDEPLRPIRLAIVGRPNVGKSTLVNALLGEDRMITGPEPGLTRDAVASDLEWEGRHIRLFDTAGLRRKSKVYDEAEKLSNSDTVRAIRFAEVVVVVLDAERPFEHQDLTIADLVIDEGRALVLAINKWDLVTEKQKVLKDLRETAGDKLAQVPGVSIVTISALGERGLDKLMDAAFKSYELWNSRVPTPDINRWLQEALQRHAPPASHGRRIKIRFMTQPSTRPPTFVAFCQRAEALPKSYIRYLVNSLRDTFGLPGVPIRLNLRKGDNPFVKAGARRQAPRRF